MTDQRDIGFPATLRMRMPLSVNGGAPVTLGIGEPTGPRIGYLSGGIFTAESAELWLRLDPAIDDVLDAAVTHEGHLRELGAVDQANALAVAVAKIRPTRRLPA